MKFIRSGSFEETIEWKGEKIRRINDLTEFLVSEGVETEKDFSIWLQNELNILKLKNIKGVKDKTVDYIKILCGIKDTVAVDLHLINFIKENTSLKVDLSYDTAKKILISVAEKIKVEPAKLDHGIWRYMSQRDQKKD